MQLFRYILPLIISSVLSELNFIGSLSHDEHKAIVNHPNYTTTTSGAHLNRRAIQAGIQTFQCLIPGTFAMTFDDGPFIYTQQLLNILRRIGVPATFFVIGENVDNDAYGPILNRMVSEGHQVASHTYSHPHLNQLSDSKLNDEIVKTSDAIHRRIGRRVNYFRCPYGECNDNVLNKLNSYGYKVINWNMDTLDWTGKSTKEIYTTYQEGLKNAKVGDTSFVSLQHDIHPNTIAIVSQLVKAVREKGFKITTVAECMGESW